MSTLTERLRRELLDARRDGDRAVAATLRSTLASLANAEAVPVAADRRTTASEHVAGTTAGPTEASRRHVSDAEQVALVRAEIADLHEAAGRYDGIDPRRAEDARAGARVLERVLAD